MPKISLVLGRRTLQVYDLDQPTIRIGRSDDMDITIDNVSISREHAHIVRADDGRWIVRDAGSSNGTFMDGQRLDGDRTLKKGDEISIGKFSIFFDRVVGDAAEVKAPAPRPRAATVEAAATPGTMHIKASDVQELLRASAARRQAHLKWRAGGEEGEHALPEQGGCVLVGRDDLCDLQVPKGPNHHLLVSGKGEGRHEVRNLSFWRRMKVGGKTTRRARLGDGDVIEIAGLELTYVDALD